MVPAENEPGCCGASKITGSHDGRVSQNGRVSRAGREPQNRFNSRSR